MSFHPQAPPKAHVCVWKWQVTIVPPTPCMCACMQVTSDGSGLGAAWHLEQVTIVDTNRGVSTVFPCGEWLDPSDMSSLVQVRPGPWDACRGGGNSAMFVTCVTRVR